MYNLRVIFACARKDFHTAVTERIFLLTLIMIPLQYLFLFILFVLASDQAPTAVVMQDNGPYAQQLYKVMANAHAFSLFKTTTQDAQNKLLAGKIVAVITIPADFDSRVKQNQQVQVPVQINNLNEDFTADIRRAVPLSITTFYAKVFPNLVSIIPREHDWYAKDTSYIPYLGVSILVIALALGGAIQSGTSWAREWELETMKELLLSPAPRWCLIIGKMVGAFFLALVSALIVMLALIGPLQTRPTHIVEMFIYMLLTLAIFSALGTLIGTMVKQRRLITTLVLGCTLPIFFVSGPLGPVTFNTPAVQFIAQFFPIAYAIAGEQHAFHNFNTNTLGTWNAIILMGFAVVFTIAAIFMLRRTVTN